MPGPLKDWTFGLIANTDPEQTVNPVWSGAADLVFKSVRPKDQIFFRRELDTELIFIEDDYAFLYSLIGVCNEITLIIYYKGVERWRGISKGLNGFNWKTDICQVTPSFSPIDDYTCVFDIMKEEENIFSIPGAPATGADILSGVIVTCTVEIGVLAGITDPDLNPFPCNHSGTGVTNNCTTGPGCQDMVLIRHKVMQLTGNYLYTETYAREELTVACVGGVPPTLDDSWTLLTDDCAGSGNAIFTRPVIAELDSENSTGGTGGDKDIMYKVLGQDTANTIPNGRKLSDLLDYFFDKCGMTVESQALNLNVVYSPPVNTFYDWSNPRLHNLVLFQKTDVKTPDAAQAATRENISLEFLINMLRETFEIYYTVSGTVATFEHISDLLGANGEDILTNYPELVQNRNNFTIDEGKQPRFEQFNWSDDVKQTDFQGLPIEYDCYDKDDEDITHAPNIVTYVGDILANPGRYSDSGFVLVSTLDVSGTLIINREAGVLTTIVHLNGALAWSNIHPKAWLWERSEEEGYINGLAVSFITAKKKKTQQDIIITKSPEDYFTVDFTELLNTQLGWGAPSAPSYSAASCELTLKLNQ
jgi:hypothetical protein